MPWHQPAQSFGSAHLQAGGHSLVPEYVSWSSAEDLQLNPAMTGWQEQPSASLLVTGRA